MAMFSRPVESTGSTNRVPNAEVVSQSVHNATSRTISHQDINLVFSLLTLIPISLWVNDMHWPSLCRVLACFTLAGRLGRRRRKRVEAGVRAASFVDERLLATVCRDLEAHQLELRLQILREQLRSDWRPKVSIRGITHLESALEAGRGAILWISRFSFADTIAKYALHRAGYPLVHLSRPTHGFSITRFGRHWLNPIYQRIENRYLAERVVLPDASPVAALRRLQEVLCANGVVSVSVYSRGAY